ncbi:ATP synthase F0 subunit B [Desulfuromonas thiophila]|uniref:ATP synthase subunit b n=1 Tax=Desulfuromonas thiophila TaxID=57664 RepID=A0A1G7CMI6_9BACT|nr:ATP synthase F0 subunit B [Desulfuromonas thiophila]SDE39876.1 F-type H+-transporting ATPase subunit b [Desulfuromonas thiophila]
MMSLARINKICRPVVLGSAALIVAAGVSYASGDAHHADSGVLLKDFLYRVFNFSITVGVLVYFVARPLKKALSGRREGIEKALREAQETAAAAEAKFAEYDAKLSRAAEEIVTLKATLQAEAVAEKERLVAQARAAADQIRQEAGKTAESEVARARLLLQQEAAGLAVELATDLLKKNFTREDQARLVEEYKIKVGELH